MPRVPVHTVADAPPESQDTLEALGERVGKVINVFGEMAHAPVLLKMYATTEDLLREESSLGEATRQAIHLAVAHSNDCGYCQAAYTGAAKAAGLSEETTKAIRRGAVPGDAKLTALLTLAREIAANTGYVADETWSAALEAGWTERELLEGYAEVVRTIMTNYVNHLVGTELDLPAVPALDGPTTAPTTKEHPMIRAQLGDHVLAESDDTIVVEGNHYFPADSIRAETLQESEKRTQCHWKGTATYHHLVVDGETTTDAAWSYPTPLPKAENITGYVAFDPRKVRVES